MTLVRTKGNLSRCCLILRVRSPGTERGLGRGALNDGGDRLEACERGGVAQMGEHLPCKQGVAGSNPTISTKEHLENCIQKKTAKTSEEMRSGMQILNSFYN